MRILTIIFTALILTSCGEFSRSQKAPSKEQHINSSELKINEQTVKPETEFEIVFTPRNKIEIIDAHIEGVNMYMGKIPLFFSQKDSSTYHAMGMVGVCSKREMVWQIQLRYRDVSSQREKTATLNFVVTNA